MTTRELPGLKRPLDQGSTRTLDDLSARVGELEDDAPLAPTPAIQLSGQNASIAATTVWTALVAGRYRASAYLRTDSAGAAGTVLVTLLWTDNAGAKTKPTATIVLTGLNQIDLSAFFYSASGGAIQYSTTVAGLVGATYGLDVLVEKLP